MNAKKFGMTEMELLQYCNSLSEAELKDFQLKAKMNDIAIWRGKFYFAVININVLAVLAVVYFTNNIIFTGCILLIIFFVVYAIRCYNNTKADQLMYKMLNIWFDQNNIN